MDKNGDLTFNILLNFYTSNYSATIMEQLSSLLKKINRWLLYKQQLEILKQKREV
jgi:phage-related holin